MNKKQKQRLVVFLIILLLLLFGIRACVSLRTQDGTSTVKEETNTKETTKKENSEATFDGEVYRKDGVIIVNKKHGVAQDYAPGEDPEAVSALMELIGDMQAQGLDVSDSYSGYRSYETQKELYESYVNSYGQEEADTFSARPGYSEHQTGLAFDLLDGNGQLLESTDEVEWLAKNAHKYGFIVRYTEDNQDITGYIPETWHIRYVGDIATDIYKSGKTLEEYLGVAGGDYE